MKTKPNAKKSQRESAQQPDLGWNQNALATPAASKYLGVSAAAMRYWRANGEGPRFFYAGERLVRYRRRDLDEWVESRLSK